MERALQGAQRARAHGRHEGQCRRRRSVTTDASADTHARIRTPLHAHLHMHLRAHAACASARPFPKYPTAPTVPHSTAQVCAARVLPPASTLAHAGRLGIGSVVRRWRWQLRLGRVTVEVHPCTESTPRVPYSAQPRVGHVTIRGFDHGADPSRGRRRADVVWSSPLPAHAHIQSSAHAHTHSHTSTHARTHTRMKSRRRTYASMHAHARTGTHARTHTQACTHTHAQHAHAHTHTHTHAYAPQP